ncbi:MAG: DUF3458 domain-containing protein, partial [Cellvibrionaceae bacterium]|nr:DUF3458 domain-containing protein [Cellvibrionaceae bacterium]
VSLFGDAGALPLKLKGQRQNPEVGDNTSMVLEFDHKDQSYCFENIAEKPVASVLRGFSAPVKVEFKRDQGELLRLMSQESDGFARWDACQQVLIELIGQLQQQRGDKAAMAQLIEPVQEAFAGLLADDSLDPAMVALMLTLPSLNYLLELAEEADVLAIYAAREALRQALAEALYTPLMAINKAYDHSLAYQPSADQIAKRSLKNTALSYLMLAADIGANDERRAEVLALCQQQYQAANNMTDQQAALLALVHSDFCQEQAQWALSDFYQRWQHEALVVNLWFSIQASRPARDALAKVEQLAEHPAFDRGNPNKVRALLGVFCNQNTYGFHASADGAAYRYLAEQVLSLDGDNPQLAARLLTPLTRWAKFAGPQRQGMRNALEGIAASATLSKDVYELVNKSLG